MVWSSFTKSESAWYPESKANDVSNLLHVVTDLTAQLEELKHDREKDVTELSLLKAENMRFKERMEMETNYLRQRVTQLESSAQQAMPLLNQTRINRQSATTDKGHTAFYAILDQPLHAPPDGTTIKFSRVITNVGNGYKANSGVFTCTASGLYYFSWSVGEVNHGHIYSELKKNGMAVGWALSGDNTIASATSQSVILHLETGEEVDIVITYTGNSPVLWEKFSSFSGFLIV
ncbi:Complement C1q-like protein 4 [Mizuhopecten yessoensis]|uniref:Complement C1q-like protein 4 n=2 Tax=Mizuhopecten yessoensis TaxID=6573 RepID=A0A210QX16_MIZYE|nr:Complement C1q-like protein 4 [Mizuhopecten yessoensis]